MTTPTTIESRLRYLESVAVELAEMLATVGADRPDIAERATELLDDLGARRERIDAEATDRAPIEATRRAESDRRHGEVLEAVATTA